MPVHAEDPDRDPSADADVLVALVSAVRSPGAIHPGLAALVSAHACEALGRREAARDGAREPESVSTAGS